MKLVGVKILQQSGDPVWAQSLTKLHLFGLTQYKRLIYLDADGLVLRNMDHLFSLPDAPVAMPRAYWLSQPRMCNALAVVQPSAERLEQLLQRARTHGELSPASWPAMHHTLLLPQYFCCAAPSMQGVQHHDTFGERTHTSLGSVVPLGDVCSDMHS